MKHLLKLNKVIILKCIFVLLLLSPINSIDANIEAYSVEKISIEKVKKNTLFKKFKPKKERRRWKDLSYGEKSYRMSMWVLGFIGLSILTAGLGIIPLVIFAILSIRLGLRSLKEKEDGISKKKRNQGIAISMITLAAAIIVAGFLVVIFSSLF